MNDLKYIALFLAILGTDARELRRINKIMLFQKGNKAKEVHTWREA